MSPARITAYEVLLRVERGGYASDLLLAHSAALDSRDAGLASEIVFGVLRFQAQLDHLIAQLSGRTVEKLDAEVRIILRMGIYQLRYLDRVPRHAGVNESVQLVRRAKKSSARGFVNAVLRKVTRDPVAWPDRAIALSHPEWMLASWEGQFGREAAESIARAFLEAPVTYVRAAQNPGERFEATEVPGCYRALDSAVCTPYRIMDIGSQSIVPLLELAPGLSFLDVCAAPGNKTAQALESGVRATACDVHLSRLRSLGELDCGRVVLDATMALPFRERFDRILVDAPCSGTGTLGRNPEIKWRIHPELPAQMHAIQCAILRNAMDRLASGGVLVYSTCSLEAEENEAVIEGVLGRPPERVFRRLPGRDAGDGFFAAVIRSK